MDSSHDHGSPIARTLWIVCTPIIFLIGVPGNLMTILVLCRSNYRRTSTSVFLLFLAIADLLVLTIVMPRWWLIYITGKDLRHFSNASCKVHWFFTYFCGGLSNEFLAVVAIERIISIKLPHKVKTWLTPKTAYAVSAIVILLWVLLHGHNIYGMELFTETRYLKQNTDGNNSYNCFQNNKTMNSNTAATNNSSTDVGQIPVFIKNETICNGTAICTLPIEETNIEQNNTCNRNGSLLEKTIVRRCWFRDSNYQEFNNNVYQPIIVVVSNTIVEGCIVIGLIVILRQLSVSRQLRKRMKVKSVGEAATNAKKSSFDIQSAQITKSLVLVSAVFILCATPVQIFLLGMSIWAYKGMSHTTEIVWVCFNLLYYTNHGVNFILYFLSGTKFREQVKAMFGCKVESRQGGSRMVVSHLQQSSGMANGNSRSEHSSVSATGNRIHA